MAIQTGSIAVSGTVKSISATKTNNNILFLSANSENSSPVLVGNKTEVEANSAFELQPGYTIEFEMDDLTILYVAGESGDKVSYLINGTLS